MKKLVAILSLVFYGHVLVAETLKLKLTSTAFLIKGEQAMGDVLFKNKTYSFRGKIAIQKLDGSQRVKIKWSKVNSKSVPSEFLSQFKTQSEQLPTGFQINITGDFKALSDNKNLVVDEVSNGGGDSASGGQGLVGASDPASEEASPVAPSSSNALASKNLTGGGNQTPQTPTSQTDFKKAEDTKDKASPTAAKEQETKQDTLQETTYETCNPVITSSAYKTRKRKVLTYQNKGKVKEGCESDRTFALLETFEGCTPRHDFQNKKTIMRKKRYYLADNGSRVDVVNCADSKITYPHLQAVFNCEPVFDQGTQKAYTTKKTYYIDATGNMQTITSCRMSSTDYQTFTKSDYLVEYSEKDRIDYQNKIAYRQIRHYIKIGDQKKMVDNWADETTNPMPIVREYDKCQYFHNKQAQKSYKQYADVYYKNGQRRVVVSCQKDPKNFFNHIADSKYCDPIVNNRKMVMRKSVYFFDQNGQRSTVEDCQISSQERDLTNADIQKDYEACQATVNLSARRAYPNYREFVQIKESKTYISQCRQDKQSFQIVETEEGCTPRFDFRKMEAKVQKRMKYNNSKKDIFVSSCVDSRNTYTLKKDASLCKNRLDDSRKQILQYDAITYVDSSGAKKIARQCESTHVKVAIDPKDIIKKYDCSDHHDIANMKVYKRYRSYYTLNGKEEEVKGCEVDQAKFYAIERDFKGCQNDYNTFTMKVTLKNKLFYNNGVEKKYISSCLPSTTQYALQRTTGTCPAKLAINNAMLVAQQQIFYVDPVTKKRVVVEDCHETDQLTAIPDSMIIKKYNECPVFWNAKTLKVTKRYRSYVKLDGQTETQIADCQFDPSLTFDTQWDYSRCLVRVDTVNANVKELAKAYYNDGKQDHYVSDCVETGTKYAIKDDTSVCPPIKLNNPTKVILQKKLYYNNRVGVVAWLTKCEPSTTVDSGQETLCLSNPITYNDNTQQAYLNTKWIYKHGDTVISLSSCQVRATRPSTTYAQELCGWEHARASSYGENGYSIPKVKSTLRFPQSSLNRLLNANIVGTAKKDIPTKTCKTEGGRISHIARDAYAKYWHKNFYRISRIDHIRQQVYSRQTNKKIEWDCDDFESYENGADSPMRKYYHCRAFYWVNGSKRYTGEVRGTLSSPLDSPPYEYWTPTGYYDYQFQQTNRYTIQCGSKLRKAKIYRYPTNYSVSSQTSSEYGNDYSHIQLDSYAKTEWGTSFSIDKNAGYGIYSDNPESSDYASSMNSAEFQGFAQVTTGHEPGGLHHSYPYDLIKISFSNLCTTSKLKDHSDSFGAWRKDTALNGRRN